MEGGRKKDRVKEGTGRGEELKSVACLAREECPPPPPSVALVFALSHSWYLRVRRLSSAVCLKVPRRHGGTGSKEPAWKE